MSSLCPLERAEMSTFTSYQFTFMPIEGYPYDGFYNGNAKMMIANGTYEDFRDFFVRRVEMKKMKNTELEAFDELWNSVPLEEKERRRNLVVEESTPRPVRMKTSHGEVIVMVATPSDGNNIQKERLEKNIKNKRPVKLQKGALTKENSPLTSVPSK